MKELVLTLRGAVYWPADDYSDRELRRGIGCGYFAARHFAGYLRRLESLGFCVRVESSERPAMRAAALVLAGPEDDPDDVCAPGGMLREYRLPCGRIVALDASATKGKEWVEFATVTQTTRSVWTARLRMTPSAKTTKRTRLLT